MRELKWPERLYVLSMIALAGAVLVWEASRLDLTGLKFILLFTPLLLVTEAKPIYLPLKGSVSGGFIVCLATNLVAGPAVATWVAALGNTSFDHIRKGAKWYVLMFNAGQVALSTAIAGHVFVGLGGIPGRVQLPNDLALIVIAAIVHFLFNSGAVTVILAMRRGLPLLQIWASNIRGVIPNFLALTPFAVLMAMTYQQSGPYGLLLFLIPMLLARHSFQMYIDMRDTYSSTIRSLTKAIDIKDRYTGGHSERVAQYAVAIGKKMGFSVTDLELLEYIALLHDIGKIGVREAILNKPGRLEPAERDEINKHSEAGAEIISQIKFLSRGAEAVRHHHERFDGAGYPDHLKGQDVSLWARIIGVADAFDAMTSERPYRTAWTVSQAVAELERCVGSQFDPEVVKVFVTILEPQLKAEEEAAAGAK
ncbi:MAG: HD-GYP domain-containing protein [Bacillota bacterium]